MYYVQYSIILHEVCEIKRQYTSKIKESPYCLKLKQISKDISGNIWRNCERITTNFMIFNQPDSRIKK